ncbi:DoxX family protein [Paenibacillus planticolens]|uniref:DoxX family protein n=1 Tax=Paenibacillus planticolens TaxID=2654976 RepID=A0ABX1ZJ32_9BACL|nr:DoxX family protein [Paenibacillus planticolens]NOU98773.1 DoxX family protein [Paenibacillus planticolens]
MNIVLWIAQGTLALGFIYSGWLKAFQYEAAKRSWTWVSDVPKNLVSFIGLSELLGVIGLILPQAANIVPVLTPTAAVGLAVIVLFGAVFHIKRGEYREIVVNIIFLALALFVAIGRLLE